MSLRLFTDAAGAQGFGAVFGSHWCCGAWPREWLGRNIAVLEFYPIVLSLFLWGDHIRDKCVTFFTDNEALVHVINKNTCKDTYLMNFVRQLVLVCLRASAQENRAKGGHSRKPNLPSFSVYKEVLMSLQTSWGLFSEMQPFFGIT